MSGNGYTVTVSASSDDNNGADIETDVPSWTATLHDATLGMAYVNIPASIALSDGDSPMDIKVDLFGWHNQTAGETEWPNGADIVRDAIVMFEGTSTTRTTLTQSEIERVKCADKDISSSAHRRRHDNDLIGSVCKSTLMLCTNRSTVNSTSRSTRWTFTRIGESVHERIRNAVPVARYLISVLGLKIQYGTSETPTRRRTSTRPMKKTRCWC